MSRTDVRVERIAAASAAEKGFRMSWYRLFAILALLIVMAPALVAPPAAHADEVSWTADPPKQVGMPVVWCTASATAGGDTYTLRNYTVPDDGRDHERWAREKFSEDVVRAMLYAFPGRSHVIQPSDVTVSCGGQR